MPLYELKCNSCGINDITMQLKLADSIPPCPKCHSVNGLEKLISCPKVTRVAEISGAIWSEKQIESTHGKSWRETAKNPFRPGGDRKALYF